MQIPYFTLSLWVIAIVFVVVPIFPATFQQKMVTWTLSIAILSGIAGFAIAYAVVARLSDRGTVFGILAIIVMAGFYIWISVMIAIQADEKTIIYYRDW